MRAGGRLRAGLKGATASAALPYGFTLATWTAGAVHRVRLHVRNARTFLPPYPGESLALGYHWKDPDRTGHWKPVIWDDGRHGLLPRGMKSGQVCVVEIDVLAPDLPYEAWVLPFCPLLIKEGEREFAIADSFLEIVRVEGGVNEGE